MKRRVAQCVAGACVAGMVAGVPGVALAGQAADAESGALTSNQLSIGYNPAIYGPPGSFTEPGAEITPVLYGPPEIFDRVANPMAVQVTNQTAKASKLATSSQKFTKAIVVKKAAGKVTYARIDKGSSKKLVVNSSTGVVAVKKGTKAGAYQLRVRVSAKGNALYAPASKTVTVKVRVK